MASRVIIINCLSWIPHVACFGGLIYKSPPLEDHSPAFIFEFDYSLKQEIGF